MKMKIIFNPKINKGKKKYKIYIKINTFLKI